MNSRSGGGILCLLGCIFFGLVAGGLSWFLLQTLVTGAALILISAFVALVTAWMLYEALCKGQAEPAGTIAATAGTAAIATAVSSTTGVEKSSTAVAKTKKPANKKPATKSTASRSRSSKSTAKTKSTKASSPKLYKSPPSKVDDLKMIAGVGPKLEGVLHNIGVYQFAQIASWKKKDIAYVDERLKFKGRIEREDWVKQAKALAKGGEAEYVKVFGKKPR